MTLECRVYLISVLIHLCYITLSLCSSKMYLTSAFYFKNLVEVKCLKFNIFKWNFEHNLNGILKFTTRYTLKKNFTFNFFLKQKPFLKKTQCIRGNICSITVTHIVKKLSIHFLWIYTWLSSHISKLLYRIKEKRYIEICTYFKLIF